MSWDKYISDQLINTGNVKEAVIAGKDGSIWATSAGWTVSPQECKTIASSFDNVDDLYMKGIIIAGEKYIFLSGTSDILRGKQGSKGIHVAKTNTAIIIGQYTEPPIVPGQCATTVEALAEYLKSVNY